MAITTRQTSLLVQQDWTKIYQTFREADFQSYDFETLRKTMIDYLRTYYPEDFNDFIESSEYIALIDLLAFLGQSLAFRTDLNARENFIDTAERRDSVLKLARLISYNPKRNVPANGFLKIETVSTTETVTDSNGIDLSNIMVAWNDTTNDNWQEQFNSIMNAAFVDAQIVGKPGNSQLVNNIQTDEYSINIIPDTVPTYRFESTVEGATMDFEAVSATSLNQPYVYEVDPKPRSKFNVLYRNDNLGNSSVNTGFFVYFKQGALNSIDFNVTESIPNRVVNVSVDNINNTDTWLYSLNAQGRYDTKWSQVPAIAGLNIAYNKSNDRNLFQVNTRSNDQVDLVFGDGAFANVPQGRYRFFYRTSNGLAFKISPDEMQDVAIAINYVSRSGRVETLSIRASLYYTVANATARENIDEIRTKAPQQYYTQNRMITGEDYNILPYTAFNSVLKAKAVNRSSSGVSRFLDVLDVTGKYSSTNIFAQDGYLYKDETLKQFTFSYQTSNEIYDVIYNQVRPILSAKSTQHLGYAYSTRYSLTDTYWYQEEPVTTNSSIGRLKTAAGTTLQFGPITASNLKYAIIGAMIKFTAPAGYFFTAQGVLKAGIATYAGESNYIYAAITAADFDNFVMTLNQSIPAGAIASQIIPVLSNDLVPSSTDATVASVQEIISQIRVYKNFGIRYDVATQNWKIIASASLGGDTYVAASAGTANDSTWIVKFVYNGSNYVVTYRGLDYIFESAAETRFYFDEKVKVFDSKSGKTIKDQVNVLKVNSQPDSSTPIGKDLSWHIYKNIVEPDGYVNNSKILVSFPDSDNDGIPDDPDLFETIVAPGVNSSHKRVFFVRSTETSDSFERWSPVSRLTVVDSYATLSEILPNISKYVAGQLFYATTENTFYSLNSSGTITLQTNYKAKIGRQDILFQYRHNSPSQRRIDPSPNNIMDLYILTKSYATDYLAWIKDTSGKITEPVIPLNEDLKLAYSSLENYKAMSDTIIYNAAKFKPIFGSKAPSSLQAKFKVVKNPNVIISDNDVKTSVIAAINSYFDVNNWDFGETFYFSELSAYLHNTLTPNIASVIIVPNDTTISFGNLYQINSQSDEIIVSAATVDDVEIISAITALQINQANLA